MGVLQWKGRPFGDKLFVGSMGRKRKSGILVKRGKGLGLVYQKPSREKEGQWATIWLFLWGMGGELDFGSTAGVATILCAPLCPPYLMYPYLRKFGWKMVATIQEREVGIPVSLSSSMIRRWLTWRVSFRDCKEEGRVEMLRIRWYGQS